MRLGLQVPHFHHGIERSGIRDWIRDVAAAADTAGLDSIWFMDHHFQLGGFDWLSPREAPMLEGYSLASFVAAATERIRIGLLATAATYRPPGLLLKTVSTLDVLSGGRANLGLGAGWYEEEARGLGLPFPPMSERFERLEETLQIIRRAWSGDFTAFHGKHYELERPINSPQPLSQPRPPILVAGSGRTKTLRLVAQYADACNVPGLHYQPLDGVERDLDVLRGHCLALGRDPETVETSVLDTFELRGGDDAPEMVARCKRLSTAGVKTVIFNIPHAFGAATIEMVGQDILPAVAELG